MTTFSFAMNIKSKGLRWIYLAVVACMLVLAGTPTAASAGSSTVYNRVALSPCATQSTVGALGQEGGLLSLRGHDESAQAVAAILHAKGSKIQSMREGYVAYVGSACLGVDGGLMGVGK